MMMHGLGESGRRKSHLKHPDKRILKDNLVTSRGCLHCIETIRKAALILTVEVKV